MIATGHVIANRYRILDRISEGGMATVYTARRLTDGEVVALKVLREQFASDDEFVERFQREARAVSELFHPNMVRVYDSGRDGSIHFIAMEYVQGENLKERIRREAPLPVDEAVKIAVQVCEALEFAHSHGVIHRDIKPQNILLTGDGRVKVTDFGIARAMSSATITQTGTVLGSVQYLSPEQARGAVVGRAADIYALGVVLFEMATGRLPFDGDSPIAIALAHVHRQPPRPGQLVPTVPERIDGIILRSLAKTPADRYRTAGEMRKDLMGETALWREQPARALEQTPPTMVLPGRLEMLEPEAGPQRRRLSGVLVPLALVALIIGGAWGGWRAFSSYLFVPEVTVPSLVGQSLDAAEEMARTSGLTLKVGERVYSGTVPIGAVISQDQPSGKVVKQGRTIYVAVSLGPEMLSVPDVQRRSLLEARLLIDQARLRIGELREAFDEEIKGGFVISQDPQPGARVERGKPINLVVSKGPQRLEMPPLVGRSLTEARRILQELGVTLAAVNTTPTPDVEPGIVVAQSPRPGTRIRAQDPVTVTVTIRPGEESVPPPAPVVTAQPQPTSRPEEKITRVQLVVPEGDPEQEVKIVVIDEGGVRTIFQKALSPGSRVSEIVRSRGYTIIQVYLQGRLVQEIRP